MLLTFHLGLLLTILDSSPVVKEGDDITITCVPSVSTVHVVWDTPFALFSNETRVSYSEPFQHSITVHNANLDQAGDYYCRVFGDRNGSVTTATAYLHVRQSEWCSVKLH